MFTRILYATDGSEAAKAAMRFAVDLAKTYAAEVIVVNAYEASACTVGHAVLSHSA